MAIECPHCFTYVHDAGDGQCPSCRQDTNDVRGLDRDLATVVIGETSPIPDVCCDCGLPTQRRIRIKKWKPIAGNDSAMTTDAQTGAILAAMYVLFGWIGGIFLHLVWKRISHDGQKVCVPMVQCDACSKGGAPRPLRVDYEHFTMRFVVHRIFKNHFEGIL